MNDEEKIYAELLEEIKTLRRRNAELEAQVAECRQAEARFRLLAENTTDLLSCHTPEGVYLYASPACRPLLGYDPKDLVGQLAYEFFHPDDRATIAASHATILEQPTVSTVSYRIRRKDGTYIWFETTSHAVCVESTGEIIEIHTASRDISERKRMEMALRESEARYRAVIESQVDLISRYRPDTTLTFVNDAYCQFYGKTRAELIGQSYVFMVAPEFRDLVRQETENLAKNPRQIVGEYLNYRHDGKACWIQWVVQCIDDEHGHVVELQAVGRDVTDRKWAEEALVESELKYRTLFKSMDQGFYIAQILYDDDGLPCDYRYLDVNSAFEHIIGLQQEHIIGKTYNELVPPDPESGWLECFKRVATTGIPENYTFPSTIYNSYFEVYAFKPEEGKFAALVKDITESKHVEEALRESEEFLRNIIENIPNMIFVKDAHELRFVRFNKAGEALLGYSREELLGKTDYDCFPKDEADFFVNNDRAVLTQKTLVDIPEESICTRDHGERILHTKKIPIFDKERTPLYLLGISEDITERKQAEEAIRTLNAELEQRVRERTAALEIANKELESFAYIVSHDLKAPLRAISRLTTWLVEDYAPAFDDKGKDLAALLIGRVQRMDNLIEGILEYSRIGRIEAERGPIDLNELIAEVIDTLAPPPHIQVHIANALPTVFAGKIRLFQVFQNLIGNAIKFLDKPQGEITIDYSNAGHYWKFTITDNGSGIDPKYHDRIFKIFQTLHPRDEIESTGIGLAVVKKIVEFYGGTVDVESTVGQGSTFWFTFPK